MAKNIKKTIRKAGKNISNKEMQKIVKKSGGSTSKALDKISSVQQSRKEAGKTAPSVGSKAANKIIKQAQSTPAGVYQLGSSKIADAIRGMAGTPAGPMIQGQQRPGTPASGLGYVPGGMTIRPSGRLGVGPKKGGKKDGKKNKNTFNSIVGPYDGMDIPDPDLSGPGPLATPNTKTWSGYTDPDDIGDGGGGGVPPIIEEPDPSLSSGAGGLDLASWATGFRRARSARQKAGKGAQGLASQKKSPFKSWNT